MAFAILFFLAAVTLPVATGQSEQCVSEGKAEDSEVLLLQTAFQTVTREDSAKFRSIKTPSDTVPRLRFIRNDTGASSSTYVMPSVRCQRYRAVEDRILEDTLHLIGLLEVTQACSAADHQIHEDVQYAMVDEALNNTYKIMSDALTDIGASGFKEWIEVTTGLPAISVFIISFIGLYVLVVV